MMLRDPLAKDRRDMQRLQRAREHAELTSAEIDFRITNAIINAVTSTGTVSTADLLRADVPRDAVTKERFIRCLDLARGRDPAVASVECIA